MGWWSSQLPIHMLYTPFSGGMRIGEPRILDKDSYSPMELGAFQALVAASLGMWRTLCVTFRVLFDWWPPTEITNQALIFWNANSVQFDFTFTQFGDASMLNRLKSNMTVSVNPRRRIIPWPKQWNKQRLWKSHVQYLPRHDSSVGDPPFFSHSTKSLSQSSWKFEFNWTRQDIEWSPVISLKHVIPRTFPTRVSRERSCLVAWLEFLLSLSATVSAGFQHPYDFCKNGKWSHAPMKDAVLLSLQV